MRTTDFKTIKNNAIVSALLLFLSGCSLIYYSAMEKFGKEKRHILIDNVENVQASQENLI